MELGWQVIRESIERLLDEETASVVLFESLHEFSEGEELPAGMEQLREFVHGPLKRVLTARVSAAEADAFVPYIVDSLEQSLGRLSVPELDIVITESEPPGRVSSIPAPGDPSLKPTVPPPAMPAAAAADDQVPLQLLVVANGKRLMFRIRASFGNHRVTVVGGHDKSAVRAALSAEIPPELVIVDGQDVPDLSPVDLGVELAANTEGSMVAVWASDQPWGNAVVQSLERQKVNCAPVPRSAGVEPLLDYVRARIRS